MKYLLIPIFFALAKAQDCTGVPDGTVIDWDCSAYTVCEDEQPIVIDCSVNGLVYNRDIMACDYPTNTSAPCGTNRDESCAYFGEGRFADWTQDCESFYTCSQGLYLGHIDCSPGTVFDIVICACNFPTEVYAPCGTKPDDGNEPTERGCPL